MYLLKSSTTSPSTPYNAHFCAALFASSVPMLCLLANFKLAKKEVSRV